MTSTAFPPPPDPAGRPPGPSAPRPARTPEAFPGRALPETAPVPQHHGIQPPSKPSRRRTNLIIVSVVAFLLAVTVGGAYWYLERAAEDLEAQSQASRTLLAQSEGRVAEPATREALTQHLEAAEEVLDGRAFIERWPGDAAAVVQDLVAAEDRVRSSMVTRARADVEHEQQRLDDAVTRAQEVYDRSEDTGADPDIREAVAEALETAVQVRDAGTTDDLADAALNDLEKAIDRLDAQTTELSAASDSLVEAADAAVCPAPDQLWDPDSGRIAPDQLAPIPWAPEFEVRADVIDSLIALNTEFREAFGVDMTINSAYRGYESQVNLADSPLAAPPGCSTHGLGYAVDIGGGVETHGSPEYTWLKEHAEDHGWTHPSWAEPDGRLPEPWHWQHTKSPAETL